jgi:hypothetical protein
MVVSRRKTSRVKVYLFRWHRHTQLDIQIHNGWLCIGYKKFYPVFYWSPDATPMNPNARGWGAK